MPAGIRGSKEAICADIFCSIAAYVCVPANFHFSSESEKVRKKKKNGRRGSKAQIKEDSYLFAPLHIAFVFLLLMSSLTIHDATVPSEDV